MSKARANGLSITSKIGTALSLVSIVSAFSNINKLIKEDCKADQKINDIGTFKEIGSIVGGKALSSGAAAIGSAATAALTAKAFAALGTTISPIAGTIIGGLIGYGLGLLVEPLGEKLGGYVGEKIGDAIIADKEDKFGTILTPPRNYKNPLEVT